MKIIKYSSNEIKNNVLQIEKEFLNLVNLLNLPSKWDKNQFYKIELIKSFIRAELRYSTNTQNLLSLINQKINTNENFKNFKWITRIYPMIHLVEDKVEGGNGLHYDQGDKNEMVTCWTSITCNDYKPLSIFIFENPVVNFFKKILVKINLLRKITYLLDSNQGEIYIWSGHRMHMGNLNESSKISCAIQFKISRLPFLTEAVKERSEFDNELIVDMKLKKISEKNNLKILNDFEIFKKIIHDLNQILESENRNNLKYEILNYLNSHDRICPKISFALSVFSQRINTFLSIYKDKSEINNFKSEIYDLASLVFGSENLISFKRLRQSKEFSEIFTNQNQKYNKLLSKIPFNTYQWQFINKNSNYKNEKILKF